MLLLEESLELCGGIGGVSSESAWPADFLFAAGEEDVLVKSLLAAFEESLGDTVDLGLAVFVGYGREEEGVGVVVGAVDLEVSFQTAQLSNSR